MIRFLRLRPFLWPLILLVPAWIVSFWMERGISYDDGGLGAFSFFAMMFFGAAGELFGDFAGWVLEGVVEPRGTGARMLWGACGIVACLPYLILDHWTRTVVRRRTEQGQ